MKKLILIFALFSLGTILLFAEPAVLDQSNKQGLQQQQVIYEKTLAFVQKNPNFPKNAKLYYNLAELASKLYYDQYSLILGYYQKTLELDPNFEPQDVVLYNIGYYNSLLQKSIIDQKRRAAVEKDPSVAAQWPNDLLYADAKFTQTISAYQKILQQYPNSDYYSEALYRLAVLFYEIGVDADKPIVYYQRAASLFSILANRDTDQLAVIGLFQRGWANMSAGDYEKAIRDFALILKKIEQDPNSLNRTYFEDDSINNIAYCLADLDGIDYLSPAKGVTYLQTHVDSLLSKSYGKAVILRAAALKKQFNAPMQAADYFNQYVVLYPNEVENPALVDSVTTIFLAYPQQLREKEAIKIAVDKQMNRIVVDYGYQSDWYTANAGNDISKVLPIIRKAYEHMEPVLFNAFVADKTEQNYTKYATLLSDYSKIVAFQDDSGKNWIDDKSMYLIKAGISLAETTKNPKHYHALAKMIYQYDDQNPDKAHYLENEITAFTSIEKLRSIVLESSKTDSMNTGAVEYSPAAADTIYIVATNRYLGILNSPTYYNKNKDQEIEGILFTRAQIKLDRNDTTGGIADLLSILKYTVEDNFKKDVYVKLAQVYEKGSDFAEAEHYYREAEKVAPSAKEKSDIRSNYLAQMQANAEKNKADGNSKTAADEFIRLSSEFKTQDQARFIGYRFESQKLYYQAGEYQKSIDLLVEIASTKNTPAEVYTLYNNAWTIADSLLADSTQALTLQNQFITKYPRSWEAYQTRLFQAAKLEKDAGNWKLASDSYIAIFNDAEAKKLDIGTDKPEDIYLQALKVVQQAGDTEKVIEMMLAFDKRYPNSPKSIEMLDYIAQQYEQKGNKEEYKRFVAYQFKRDPNSTRYQELANGELKAVYDNIASEHEKRNWKAMQAGINEFTAMYNAYSKDGLKLQLESVFEDFASFNNDYKLYVELENYKKSYLNQLTAIETGFIHQDPNALLRVTNATRWNKNLYSGDKRIDALVDIAVGRENQVIKLINNSAKYDIPTEYRTKALLVLGSIYEKAINVLDQQVNKYLRQSNEINGVRGDAEVYQQVVDNIQNYVNSYDEALKEKSSDYYKKMLTLYSYGIGYSDANIVIATEKLTAWNLLPNLEIMNEPLDEQWSAVVTNIEDSTTVDSSVISHETLKGLKFGYTILAPDRKMTCSRDIHFTVQPEMLYIHVLGDDEAEIRLNQNILDVAPIIMDTLSIGDRKVNRWLYPVKKSMLDSTVVNIEVTYSNERQENCPLGISVAYTMNSVELSNIRDFETKDYYTDLDWEYSTEIEADSTKTTVWNKVNSAKFSFDLSAVQGILNSSAKAIWASDTDSLETVTFRKTIDVPTEVSVATLSYVGQSVTSIWINGNQVVENGEIMINPESGAVIADMMEIPADLFTQGDNIITATVKKAQDGGGLLMLLQLKVKKLEGK